MTADFEDMSPEEREVIAAQLPVMKAAWSFLLPALRDGDLLAAWPLASPALRLCWVQSWIVLNRQALEANGYEAEALARDLAVDEPRHEVWQHFQRVFLRDCGEMIRGSLDDEHWGIGVGARLVAPDVELLYLHRKQDAGVDVWQPDEEREVLAILMELSEGQWRVLNLGSDSMPQPGWPPTF